MTTESIWFEAFANLLGCEAKPGAIAHNIEVLQGILRDQQDRIPKFVQQSRDELIIAMRNHAVNCGPNPTCSVAGWFLTSKERAEKAVDDGGKVDEIHDGAGVVGASE